MTASDVLALLDADAERAGKVEALAGAATEGPWSIDVLESGEHGLFVDRDPEYEGLGCGSQQVAGFLTERNATFVSASRTETPWLVERLRARDEAIRAVLGLHVEHEPAYEMSGYFCAEDGDDWPCPTVAALASALGGGEQQ